MSTLSATRCLIYIGLSEDRERTGGQNKRSESGVPTCDDPGTPENGVRIENTTFYIGTELLFACNSGYVLQGSEVLTCTQGTNNESHWDEDLPRCVGKQ